MSTTRPTDRRPEREDFTEEHGVEPSLLAGLLGLVGLAIIVAGDFASFNIAISRSFTGMGPVMVLLLTLAMTAAAVLLMVEAGRAEARRRGSHRGRTGRGAVLWRVFAWSMVGVTAFLLRMAAPPEETGTGGFGDARGGFGEGATGGFGGAATGGFASPGATGFGAAAEPGALQLGPLAMHAENLTSAIALFAIFLAGGVGAYYWGRESYNPRVTAVRRARRREESARRRLERPRAQARRARRRADAFEAAGDLHDRSARRLHDLAVLQQKLDTYEREAEAARASAEQVSSLAAQLGMAQAELDTLPNDVRSEQRRAEQAGEVAKQLARVLVAEHQRQPAAQAGVTNGAEQ
jgi:hypothetical protein